MADDLNTVAVGGRLTRDAERVSKGLLKLSIGNTRNTKKGDEYVDHSNFFDVAVIGSEKHLDWFERDLVKGTPVTIAGELEFRQWEKDGQKRSAVGIKTFARQVHFSAGPKVGKAEASPATPSEAFADSDIPF